MLQIILIILQSILIISISPLVIGYIRKIKARMQSRVGSPIYQPYVELYKLVRKDSVVPKNTSWVFLTVPYLLVAIVVTISFFIPAITIVSTTTNSYMDGILDIMGIIYLLAFFTFLIAIAAFDAGSSFGGLGAAREYMFSVIVEPIMFMAFLAPVIISGSAQISQIINYNATNFSLETFAVLMICLIGFFIALLAENARFPFDNPSTHLELTMVHEAMILDYSGKQLALVEVASWIKLVLFFSIASAMFIPWGINVGELTISNLFLGLLFFLIKIFSFATVIALIESTIAKLRIMKLPTLLAFAFLLVTVGVIYMIIFVK